MIRSHHQCASSIQCLSYSSTPGMDHYEGRANWGCGSRGLESRMEEGRYGGGQLELQLRAHTLICKQEAESIIGVRRGL